MRIARDVVERLARLHRFGMIDRIVFRIGEFVAIFNQQPWVPVFAFAPFDFDQGELAA